MSQRANVLGVVGRLVLVTIARFCGCGMTTAVNNV